MAETTEGPGNRWQHPTHLEKVRRNEANNQAGIVDPNSADDHPAPTPIPGSQKRGINPQNPSGY